MNDLIERAKDARMGFCAGLSALAVTVPPQWDAWLAGEVNEITQTLWIAAFAAVARGLLAVAQKIGGFKLPFSHKVEEKADAK